MSSIRQGHLTDGQFAECITESSIVAPRPESEAHLRECAQCREELARFTESMADFSRVAFSWSEAQPAVSLRAVASPAPSRTWFIPATWAVTAAVVAAIGIPLMKHRDRQPAAPAETTLADVQDDSDAQIAEDNRLMRSVNMAIGVNDPSPLREYGLQPAHHARLKKVSGLRSE